MAPNTVETLNINDRRKFSPDQRVRQKLIQSNDLLTEMNCYEPGQETPMHVHPAQDEVLFCVEGKGAITFEDRDDVALEQGSLVSVAAGIRHRVVAGDGRMVLIFSMKPAG